MQKNSFVILGINETATISEITDAYEALVKKYKEERFSEGETGNIAAKKLAEVEQAYKECMEYVHSNAVFDDVSQIYAKVNESINGNKIDEAQAKLDKIEYRDAEWHYYQSIIYFKKNWLDESRKQLELSVALEPTNTKYNDALVKIIEYAKSNVNVDKGVNGNQQQQQQRAGYVPPNTRQRGNGDACCNTCCTLMCLDSCCECCGGDLISCC